MFASYTPKYNSERRLFVTDFRAIAESSHGGGGGGSSTQTPL
jgi:hypothetical protein